MINPQPLEDMTLAELRVYGATLIVDLNSWYPNITDGQRHRLWFNAESIKERLTESNEFRVMMITVTALQTELERAFVFKLGKNL